MPTPDTSLGKVVYDATYAAMPDLRAYVRIDRRTSVECVCASSGVSRVMTDQGLATEPAIEVRLPVSTIPDGALSLGSLFEFSRDGTEWDSYRVASRLDAAGLARVTLGDKDGGL